MKTQTFRRKKDYQQIKINDSRERLLTDIPVTEYRFDLAGASTAILEGGEGAPIILLHGPGESAIWWMRVIPKLVTKYHVTVPDLPGHGYSWVNDVNLDTTNTVLNWLKKLIEHTTFSPPVLVGHLLGGSIAARFAVDHSDLLSKLVLVNSFRLGKFRPTPTFAYRLIRFLIHPTKKNYNRFLPHCFYDVDNFRKQFRAKWEPFLTYNLECARDPERKSALRQPMKQTGVPKIAPESLDKIKVPTYLIWGRHDKANELRIAQTASKRYGWPLHIIEEARDEPKLEQPDRFVQTLLKL